jgi:hypothetical protein
MGLWSKIDNFFAPRPVHRGAAAAAAAAAADILLYVVGLMTRPERAKDLVERVERLRVATPDEQLEELMPLYFDLEKFLIENEPVKNYTRETLRLDVYTSLNLKDSTLPFVSFFTPGIEGALDLAKELFSKVAYTAFEAIGKRRVEQIILSTVEGTIFDGVEIRDGILDFTSILGRLKNEESFEKEFKSVFSLVSLSIAQPVKELRGEMPSVQILRAEIIYNWQLLSRTGQTADSAERSVIPISSKAREMINDIGLGELITRGLIEGVDSKLIAKNGESQEVRISASALKDMDGNTTGMVISAKDLSQIQRLEKEKLNILETAKENAESVVQERTSELERSKAELERLLESERAARQQLKASEQQMIASNQQLSATRQNLTDKLMELERFNKVAVGRELRMMELKEEIKRLKAIVGSSDDNNEQEVSSD